MTVELATYHGVTREEAHENYMHALAQLVVYLCRDIAFDLIATSDYMAFLHAKHRVPTPWGTRAVIGFQALEHCRMNPPRLRTIELVSA